MGAYVPADPSNQESQRIAQALSSPNESITLNKLYVLPKKYGDGTVIFADSTLGLGGSTTGYYGYYGGAWAKLG